MNMEFHRNILNHTSDGTNTGDLGTIPQDWHSEPVFEAVFHSNEKCQENPSINDGTLYLSEVTEICKSWNISATLYDATGSFVQGEVNQVGEYRLGH